MPAWAVSLALLLPVGATGQSTQGDGTTLQRVEIVGALHRLDLARNALSPETGSSVYRFNQEEIGLLPLGDQTPIRQLMLQAPGVVLGDYGELHIRGEMTQPQYRLNGIVIPEGISGFSEVLDTRIASSIRLITGALPAQYGFRTAGVVEITTRQGLADEASAGLLAGSHDTVSPSFDASGIRGPFSYYVSGSWMDNAQGILSPTPQSDAIHDRTRQGKGFAYATAVLSPSLRLGLIAGSAVSRFQIPNVPRQAAAYSLASGQTVASEDLQEKQKEANRFVVLSLQGGTEADTNFQLAAFMRDSSVVYEPDQIGDLIYRGVAGRVARTNRAVGLQADASRAVGVEHTVRAGLSVSDEHTDNRNDATVFPGDRAGQTSDVPVGLVDVSNLAGRLFGAYVQDEWAATPKLTVIYGVRADRMNAAINAGQISPRLAVLYEASPRTRLHAGYSRYFTAQRLELVAPATLALFAGTTAQPEVNQSSPVLPARMHYFDAGISQQLTDSLSLSIDGYVKKARHLGDFGQFGPSLVFSPFNWDRAFIKGLEVTASYKRGDLSGYLNVAMSSARARGINSGEYNFRQDELDYINSHWVYMDHDQRYAVSSGFAVTQSGTRYSADMVFGSGMRLTPDGGAPNSGHLPAYLRLNAGAARDLVVGPLGRLEVRVAVLNALDRVYQIRDGTGVGVGAPQYGPRRAFYMSARKLF